MSGYPLPDHPITSLDLIDRARAHGFDLVQIADNLPVHELSSGELVTLRDHAMKSGTSIEIGTVGFEREHLQRYLHLARFLGARLVRTLIRTSDGKPDLLLAEKCIRSVADEYRSAGVELAIENYEQLTCAELASLVERIDNPFVGICLDTVNSFGALETPRQVVEILGPFVQNLHIKDFTIRRLPSKMGFEIIGCPAGEGNLEIEWIISELRRHGRHPSVILEQWTPWAGCIGSTIAMEEAWADRSITYLRGCR
jgi:sugar phosphate isomerase/epimerase